MKQINLAGLLVQNRFWVKIVTKKSRKLKKENPENPFLSHDQKTKLFIDWKEFGCIKSRDKLLDSLYPLALQLVHNLVNRLGNNNVSVEDLEQEANLALLYTLQESDYDPKMGTLPTYFRSRLPMFFFRALKDYGNVIRIPDNILKDLSSENKAYDDFIKIKGRYPENGEIHLYKDKEYLFGEKVKIDSIVSGNKLIGDDDDSCELFDVLGESFDVEKEFEIKQEILNTIVKSLTKREQELIQFAYFTEIDRSEILYQLKPFTTNERQRLYKRSENILKIETSDGEMQYNFFAYKNAKKRKSGNIVQTNILRPVTHFYSENYQDVSKLKFVFGSKDLIKISLNGKDLTNQIKIIDNQGLKNTINSNDILFELNCELKTGSIYSMQSYNSKVKQIKDKIRKKSLNYEIFRTTL